MIGPYGFALPEAQRAWRAHIAECMAESEKIKALEALLKNRAILGSRDFVNAARRAARPQPAAAVTKGSKKGSDPFSRRRGLTPLPAAAE